MTGPKEVPDENTQISNAVKHTINDDTAGSREVPMTGDN